MAFTDRLHNRGSISGYDIDNSLKLESDNSEYLKANNTFAYTTPTSRYTGTVSFWIKRTEIGNNVSGNTMYIFASSGSARYSNLGFDEFDNLTMYSGDSSWNNVGPYTSNKFRDTSAWYHIVIRYDTTDSTASNRLRVYSNGTEVSWVVAPNITQNGNMTYSDMNGPTWHSWGTVESYFSPSNFFNGYLAEAHFVDGQSLAPTEFGEYDSASGIWKPKEYDGTYGNCGYYLDFADSANLGDDESGNGFDFDENNITAADQATDTPTNNFATMNPLHYTTKYTITEGGTRQNSSVNGWGTSVGSIGVTSGKWYFEIKSPDNNGYTTFGAIDADSVIDTYVNGDAHAGDAPYGISHYGGNGSIIINGSAVSGTSFPTWNTQIMGCALDLDNNKIYFSKDGTYGNSGNPVTGANGISLPSGGSGTWFFSTSTYVQPLATNQGGFTTISISSAETDENGYGTFEYAPPSGYYALCTKNLAEYG